MKTRNLMLGDLLLQSLGLGPNGLGVSQSLLRGAEPLQHGLQCLVELLRYHQDALKLLVSAVIRSGKMQYE